jgi:hypothetical protein
MTPKEKAENLVKLFTFSCHECDNATISALLAVDEIISVVWYVPIDIEYWTSVKQEIEKL